jgi:6-phosphogluconolactonase
VSTLSNLLIVAVPFALLASACKVDTNPLGDAAVEGGGGSAGTPQSQAGAGAAGKNAGAGAAGNDSTHGTGGAGGEGGKSPAAGSGGAAGAQSDEDAGGPLGDEDGGVAATNEILYVGGDGTDVTVFGLNPKSGALSKRGSVNGGSAPSYLAVSPNKKYLYAIDENNGDASSVTAFTIDPRDGHLTLINNVATGGQGAPHLAVHPSGKWLVVAHYTSGETSVLPIRSDGGVSAPTTITTGPTMDCMNAHEAVFDHTGKYLFVPCLGSDYIIQFKFEAGQLTYNDPSTAPSNSPRHMSFDPNEHFAYVISEYDTTITWYAYDANSGKLSNPQTIPSYQTMAGAGAQIVVHPSGKWLYVSNRTENSLGLFALAKNGTPSPVAFETDMIATPRDFSLDPLGEFLLLANQNGDQNVFVYRIAPSDGRLSRVAIAPVGNNPTCTNAIILP